MIELSEQDAVTILAGLDALLRQLALRSSTSKRFLRRDSAMYRRAAELRERILVDTPHLVDREATG